MATLADLIDAALLDLGVLAVGEVADAAQAAQGLSAINALVDQWKGEDLLTYTVLRATATLTASQTSFTVGSSGNINIARPVYIDHINFIDTTPSPDLEMPLIQMTDDDYAALPMKALTATYPYAYWYSPTYPTGTLYPFPIPTSSTLLWAVYYHSVVAEFAAISDVIALPPGYRRMVVKNLAAELAPSYSREISGLLAKQAGDAKTVVKRINEGSRLKDMYFSPDQLMNQGGWRYNILTDK